MIVFHICVCIFCHIVSKPSSLIRSNHYTSTISIYIYIYISCHMKSNYTSRSREHTGGSHANGFVFDVLYCTQFWCWHSVVKPPISLLRVVAANNFYFSSLYQCYIYWKTKNGESSFYTFNCQIAIKIMSFMFFFYFLWGRCTYFLLLLIDFEIRKVQNRWMEIYTTPDGVYTTTSLQRQRVMVSIYIS